MIKLEKSILTFIVNHALIEKGDSIIASVSGGPDSVALSLILNSLKEELGFDLSIFHLDHSLRKTSSKDKEFVQEFAKNYNIKFYGFTKDVAAYKEKRKLSTQTAAREIRYKLLEDTAKKIGATKIATGHQADDQLETFFLRLLRGASLAGLKSIPKKRGPIIRPLLNTPKDQLIIYLREMNQPFLTDPSNVKPIYFRNRVRNELIPVLKKLKPAYREVLSKNLNLIEEEENYLDSLTNQLSSKLIRKDNNFFVVKVKEFSKQPLALKRRLLRLAILQIKGDLKGIEYKHIELILNNYNNFGFTLELPGQLLLYRDYKVMRLGLKKDFLPLAIEEKVFKIGQSFEVKPTKHVLESKIVATYSSGPFVACLDYDKLKLPLTVRSRKPGDYFKPLGTKGTKKLQDYFVDNKIPKFSRDLTVIIQDRDKILWIAGYHIDERAKIEKNTKKILRLQLR